MTPDPIQGRARQWAGVLSDLASTETENMRWLRENAAAIRRAHADMLAERRANPLTGAAQ